MTARSMRRRLLAVSVAAGGALGLASGAVTAAPSADVPVTANVPPVLTVTAGPGVTFATGSTTFSNFPVKVLSNDHYSLGASRADAAAPLLPLPLSIRVATLPSGAASALTAGVWNSLASPVTLGGRSASWTSSTGDDWLVDFQNDLGSFPRAGSYGSIVTFTATTVS
ncbi:MAG: hypothetical protein U0Y82_05425 [Thermoleophilia bacterium]